MFPAFLLEVSLCFKPYGGRIMMEGIMIMISKYFKCWGFVIDQLKGVGLKTWIPSRPSVLVFMDPGDHIVILGYERSAIWMIEDRKWRPSKTPKTASWIEKLNVEAISISISNSECRALINKVSQHFWNSGSVWQQINEELCCAMETSGGGLIAILASEADGPNLSAGPRS